MNSLLTMSTYVMMMMLFIIGNLQMVMAKSCGPNEKETDCAPIISCQPSCEHPNGTACPRICDTNSCVCEQGFVRDNNNNLECVNPLQCTINIVARKKRQSICGPNEIESSCALLQHCQPSCDNPQGTDCPMICSRNPCICQDGYIRLSRDNLTCVETAQCTNETMLCGENEVYDSCPNPCSPTCSEPNRPPCPVLQCSGECVCKPGYFRNMEGRKSSCAPCPQVID